MKDIVINKQKLTEILRKNLEEHRDIFLEAQNNYREQVIKELEKSLEDARTGKTIRTYIELRAPLDHTKDYNRVLKMLEMEERDIIELTEKDFQSYVQDEWDWTRQWAVSNSNYSNNSKLADVLNSND